MKSMMMFDSEKTSLNKLLVPFCRTHFDSYASVMTFNSRVALSRGDAREEMEPKLPTVFSEKWVPPLLPPTFPDLASRTFASLCL